MRNLVKLSVLALAPGAAEAFAMGGAGGARAAARGVSSVRMSDFYDFKLDGLSGGSMSMSDYKGKPVLILNVASL
jgi:hypothetical protein